MNRITQACAVLALALVGPLAIAPAGHGTAARLHARAAHAIRAAKPEQMLTGRASVVDGDTLEIHGQRIRLHGIDAPESRQMCHRYGKLWPCGRRAAFALADLIGARVVTCRWHDLDRWHRAIAVCRTGRTDLGAWMVASGWALAFRRYSRDYLPREAEARLARRGLWTGRFVPPWAHRAGRRDEVSAESYGGT